ncbi:PKD domain-containing protein [Tamlana flava]|uniref:PKD domain-containing protein n=1 Tax=Tamlana flava TaxID=3158572 RepID=UPI00351AD067
MKTTIFFRLSVFIANFKILAPKYFSQTYVPFRTNIIVLLSLLCVSFTALSQNLSVSERIQKLPLGHQLRSSFDELTPQTRVNFENWLNRLKHVPDEDFNSLRIDNNGGIQYADYFPVQEQESVSTQNEPVVSQAISASDVFMLHSRPGAPNTLYLDFDGMVISGKRWNDANGVSTYYARPYDSDGDESSFSDAEHNYIASIWQQVSDDFAAFNIDVTTEEPSSFGPYVGHVLITNSVDQNNINMPCGSCGGYSYVGVFGSTDYEYSSPALVYYNNLGTNIGSDVVSSHEFGHHLGLSHHGGGGHGSYYNGHGSGLTSWAPIMGSSYRRHVTQWDYGSYAGANNTGQNDINEIENLLGNSADDHGNDINSATPLIIASDGSINVVHEEMDPMDHSSNNKGIIENASDVDCFSFSTSGGQVALNVIPSWKAFYDGGYRSANLDILAKLYDDSGNLIGAYSWDNETRADISVNLSAGLYYLSIEGEGSSNYSDYCSTGKYYITGTIGNSNSPVAGFSANVLNRSVNFTDGSTASNGSIVAWYWDFGDGSTSPQQNPSHVYALEGKFVVSLTVVDDSGDIGATLQSVNICIFDNDGDGVCNSSDICPGGDDNIDVDADGIPDACDDLLCTASTGDFGTSTLTHSGTGSNSTFITIPTDGRDVGFTISNIDLKDNGNPKGKYIEQVTVSYIDGNNTSQLYGIFSGSDTNAVVVDIQGTVKSVTVELTDIYDGDLQSGNMSINLSSVDFCTEIVLCTADADNDGVCDIDDQCPGFDDTIDTDGDGIPDGCDTCNDLVDNDADGVSDCIDQEINSPCPNNVDANGVSLDSDGDGVCDDLDICPGGNDTIDTDGDGIPDYCDVPECVSSSTYFTPSTLTHSGSGSSSASVTIPSNGRDLSFTISDLDEVTGGKPTNRYVEQVTVSYIDSLGANQTYGVFSGNGSVNIDITDFVQSVTVSLTDGYDDNAPITLSVDLGIVDYCVEGGASPSAALSLGSTKYDPLSTGIKVYPNPSQGHSFKILLNSVESKVHVKMYSILGRLVLDQDFNPSSKTIEIKQPLISGLYIIKVNDIGLAKLIVK